MPKESWRDKAKNLKTDIYALYLSCRDPKVPWRAKAVILLTIGYFLSPIDLIPDFIPVIGQIDDLIIVPAGISLAVKMIPKSVMEENRRRAREQPLNTRAKWIVAALIVSLYAFVAYVLVRLFFFR
jgi:uncharacterized membrane protein YkvA (DUF1232 family)